MKTIKLHNWEIEALAYKRKSSIRVPLYVQPMKDETGMWHWRDCQWMDGGLGFPQSGIVAQKKGAVRETGCSFFAFFFNMFDFFSAIA